MTARIDELTVLICPTCTCNRTRFYVCPLAQNVDSLGTVLGSTVWHSFIGGPIAVRSPLSKVRRRFRPGADFPPVFPLRHRKRAVHFSPAPAIRSPAIAHLSPLLCVAIPLGARPPRLVLAPTGRRRTRPDLLEAREQDRLGPRRDGDDWTGELARCRSDYDG